VRIYRQDLPVVPRPAKRQALVSRRQVNMSFLSRGALALLLFFSVTATNASADTFLFDWALNLNGTVYVTGDALPANVNAAGFDFTTGLGTLTIQYTAAVAENVFLGAFFDHEIDESINTFFNEVGTVSGAAGAGQSWEIDEPGFVFGDIYTHILAGSLDSTIGSATPDDVSMAMGWVFAAAAGDTVGATFLLSTNPPASTFYLRHYDPDSDLAVYLSGSPTIGPEIVIPEPGSVVLLATAAALTILAVRRRRTA
jgi:hypothetical protein